MRRWFLNALAILGASVTLAEQTPEAVPDPVDGIRREAWGFAALVIEQLEQSDPRVFAGIHAWLAEVRPVAALVNAADPAQPLPVIDSDALVTRSPRFWAAYYEITPADPVLALLHASLLLSGGEAQRAAYLATLGQQRAGTPEVRRALRTIIEYSQAAQERSGAIVKEGIKRYDARDFDGALEQFDAALAEWPANGWAHYERGLALRMQTLAASGQAPPKGGNALLPESGNDPEEATAAFARARRHDPFRIMAYQGEDPDLLAGFMALVRNGLPTWEALKKSPEQPIARTALVDFADACRQAGIDDLALAVRQHLVVRNKRYQPDDQTFIGECLRRLAAGDITRKTLARLASENPLLTRLTVPLPATTEIAAAEPQTELPTEVVDKKPAANKGPKASKTAAKKSKGSKSKTSSTKGKKKKRS
jgi:tetratricopeptide (TPR) repeat protein